MTRRRTFAYALLAMLVVLLVAAHGAAAASSEQIWRDAADGVIDGDYSISELRGANSNVPAELSEYGGWSDIYRAALRRKANPDAPVVVVPRDTNGNGKIDAVEKAVAVKETKERNARKGGKPIKDASDANPNAESCDDDSDSDTCNEGAAAADDDDSDDGGSPLVWIVVGLPILIILFGAWRMLRTRRAGDSNPAAAPKPERFDPPKGDGPR